MNIRIDPHTLQRAAERGATDIEIKEVLETGVTLLGKGGRSGKAKVFSFAQERNGTYFEEKKIEVYYVIENDEIITVTVYVFYGKF